MRGSDRLQREVLVTLPDADIAAVVHIVAFHYPD
jgi:hypothetical protein